MKLKTRKVEAGKYELDTDRGVWTVERWVADEKFWIGYNHDLNESTEPMETKYQVVCAIKNGWCM